MKKLLLSGIAALFLATGAAHADTLPKEMLGNWCMMLCSESGAGGLRWLNQSE
jgi:hypothetical protein